MPAILKRLCCLLIPGILPAAFCYYWLEAGRAEGWGGWAYGVVLGTLVISSALVGLSLLLVALVRKRREQRDWGWLVAGALVGAIPALAAMLFQVVR